MALLDTDGTLKEYNDEYDIVIHCESQPEQEKVMELLNTHLKETGKGVPPYKKMNVGGNR